MVERLIMFCLGVVITAAIGVTQQPSPVQACSARPLVLTDACGGFTPLRPLSKTVDYIALNDPSFFDQVGQNLLHGQKNCGWRK